MRLGGRFSRKKPFTVEDWYRSWKVRGPREPTTEQLLRRNELLNFRLVLAAKEPKEDRDCRCSNTNSAGLRCELPAGGHIWHSNGWVSWVTRDVEK